MSFAFDIGAILQGGTLLVAAWTLFEVHSLRVAVEVLAAKQGELERRVVKLEKRAGL